MIRMPRCPESRSASKAILAQDTAEFGHLPIVREYYPGLPSANAWTAGLPATSKSAVIVSFKALPSAILSGADNAALSHFFDTAPAGTRSTTATTTRPRTNIAAGQFSLAAYKQAWAHVVALATAAHNLYLRLDPDPHGLRPHSRPSHRNWKNYLPGGGIISTLGWDAYPQGTGGGQHVPQLTAPATFKRSGNRRIQERRTPLRLRRVRPSHTNTAAPAGSPRSATTS